MPAAPVVPVPALPIDPYAPAPFALDVAPRPAVPPVPAAGPPPVAVTGADQLVPPGPPGANAEAPAVGAPFTVFDPPAAGGVGVTIVPTRAAEFVPDGVLVLEPPVVAEVVLLTPIGCAMATALTLQHTRVTRPINPARP